MELGLKNKGAIVTGASRGIGYAIADAFAREGVNVAICGRNKNSLDSAVSRLSEHGVSVYGFSCDMGNPEKIAAFVSDAGKALGHTNILVNNPSGFGMEDNEEDWRKSVDVDLMGLVRSCWHAAPLIEAAGGGSIIHISSISGMTASTSRPYGAVKAAVIHYTRTQAKAFAEKNIRVNCIAPGSIFFKGGLWDDVRTDNPDMFKSVVDEIPFGRMGTPREIASTAVFLASDAASWITGQTVAVDGGQMLSG